MQGVLNPAQSRFPTAEKRGPLSHWGIPEVWVRFLLAIVGLGLAFGAALFSTVTRETGNLWATVAMASLALLLAVFVGLTTVPYLAKRVAGGRIRNAFDYEVTRAGMIYVGIVVVIGVAALNTGNNLLYIIMAAMLAAILVSGVASAFVLRGLRLDVRLPGYAFAGRLTPGRILLSNPRKWMPSFSISVISLQKDKVKKQWRWVAGTFTFPPRGRSKKQWLTLPDRQLRRVPSGSAPAELFRGAAYFPYLPPRSQFAREIELSFARRGRYQQEGFGLATRFPFAFLTKMLRVPLTREVIVYPSVAPTGNFFDVLPLITGEFESFVRGRGQDLYRIREYTQDDSARHVDWKATAKSGALKVREYTREDERKLRIVFDNPQPGQVSAEEYEKAIALAASLGWHFAEANAQITFAVPDYQGADVHQFLKYLATAEVRKSASLLESLPPSSEYNVIFTTQPRGTLPTTLWASSYFIFIGKNN